MSDLKSATPDPIDNKELEDLMTAYKKRIEEWRPIPGYEGYYEVSSFGHVRSIERYSITPIGKRLQKGRMLKLGKPDPQYLRVRLSINGAGTHIPVHRLVCLAFIPNPENKPHVNHIDCNKFNNHADNLEWCTRSENALHAYKHGLMNNVSSIGSRNSKSKLTEEIVLEARSAYASGTRIRELALRHGVHYLTMQRAIQGRLAWKEIIFTHREES